MLIDCDTCAAPEHACAGCMMTTLLPGMAGRRRARLRLDDSERAAVDTLARAGLVSPLRLVRAVDATDAYLADPAVDHLPISPGSTRGIA